MPMADRRCARPSNGLSLFRRQGSTCGVCECDECPTRLRAIWGRSLPRRLTLTACPLGSCLPSTWLTCLLAPATSTARTTGADLETHSAHRPCPSPVIVMATNGAENDRDQNSTRLVLLQATIEFGYAPHGGPGATLRPSYQGSPSSNRCCRGNSPTEDALVAVFRRHRVAPPPTFVRSSGNYCAPR